MGALDDPRQALRAGACSDGVVLDFEPDPVVLYPEPQPVLLEVEPDIYVMGDRMPLDVRYRLLGDAKECQLDRGSQSAFSSGDGE